MWTPISLINRIKIFFFFLGIKRKDKSTLIILLYIYIFLESFNLWRPLLMIALYHQTKISISFWCKWGLNPKSLIQPLETLSVELEPTILFYI